MINFSQTELIESDDAILPICTVSLLSVYYENFDDHVWALSWVLEYY